MFKFPKKVEVKAKGRIIRFHVTEICHNVFAMQEYLHAMKNEDGLTFGYIFFHDGYLYTYCASVEDTSRYKLIYVSYVGPEDQLTEEDSKMINNLFHMVALTISQFALYENQHPAMLDRQTFETIYESMKRGINGGASEAVTPFVTPMRDLAVELRDFYDGMITGLDEIQEIYNHDNDSH